jgi:DNA polymerase
MQKINNKILLESIKFAEGEFLPLQFIEKQELIEEIVQKFDTLNNIQAEKIESADMEIDDNMLSQFDEPTEIIQEGIQPQISDKSISNWQESTSMLELSNAVSGCMKCKFGETRTNIVFGDGNPNAEIMIIGEAPGKNEDLSGIPFVGDAGKLLDKILEAIKLSRQDVYIANVVKCRPPGNKTPTEDEFAECLPYLKKQIELVSPKIILTLGAVPLLALFGKGYQITKVRGQELDYNGIIVIPTFHPAYLIYNPSAKKYVWEDVQKLEKIYQNIQSEK